MTLQASGAISLTDVLNELRIANTGRNNPISLGDSDVLALAGKGGNPTSLSDLYGKSSFKVTGNSASNKVSSINGAGTCWTYPSVTVIGGSSVTYQWTVTASSGVGATLGSATSQTCSLSSSYSQNTDGYYSVTLQCAVRNGNGATITVTDVTANGSWYSNK
jgi:hypothetical protein